eukprot:1947486-Pleurochrysis_carterae.AAC.1
MPTSRDQRAKLAKLSTAKRICSNSSRTTKVKICAGRFAAHEQCPRVLQPPTSPYPIVYQHVVKDAVAR